MTIVLEVDRWARDLLRVQAESPPESAARRRGNLKVE
jgi:hypothetical protein